MAIDLRIGIFHEIGLHSNFHEWANALVGREIGLHPNFHEWADVLVGHEIGLHPNCLPHV